MNILDKIIFWTLNIFNTFLCSLMGSKQHPTPLTFIVWTKIPINIMTE